MNYYDKIKQLAYENNNIVTSQMIIKEGVPSIYLTRMVKQGELDRIDRGVYSTDKIVIDEYYLLYQKNRRAIFSFSSALYLHGITDRIPFNIEITLPSKYNSSHIPKDIIVHKVVEKYYSIGRINKTTIFGNEVACYDLERTMCDLIRFRNKIDVEIFQKAVKGYKNNPARNFHTLRRYAKVFHISRQIDDLLDVI